MEWPLKRGSIPVSKTPTWSLYYQAACPSPADPTIIWGTDLPTAGIQACIRRANAQSDVLISPAHVLIWAVGRCLAKRPEFNRRLLARRQYEFRQVNVLVPMQVGNSGPEVCLMVDVDQKPLDEIAKELWEHSRQLQKGISPSQRDAKVFRLLPGFLRNFLFRFMLLGNNWVNSPAMLWGHRTLRAGTVVNYLGHRGAPPMRMYKPSRFPTDVTTMSVTLGPAEPDHRGEPVAPLFVRVDHRIVDAHQLSQFVGDLRDLLIDPSAAVVSAPENLKKAA